MEDNTGGAGDGSTTEPPGQQSRPRRPDPATIWLAIAPAIVLTVFPHLWPLGKVAMLEALVWSSVHWLFTAVRPLYALSLPKKTWIHIGVALAAFYPLLLAVNAANRVDTGAQGTNGTGSPFLQGAAGTSSPSPKPRTGRQTGHGPSRPTSKQTTQVASAAPTPQQRPKIVVIVATPVPTPRPTPTPHVTATPHPTPSPTPTPIAVTFPSVSAEFQPNAPGTPPGRVTFRVGYQIGNRTGGDIDVKQCSVATTSLASVSIADAEQYVRTGFRSEKAAGLCRASPFVTVPFGTNGIEYVANGNMSQEDYAKIQDRTST